MPTFADRGAAIARRLEAIKSNPKYQALPEDKKTAVRSSLYHSLVKPSYENFHLGVPDEKTWVEATGRDTAFHHYNKFHEVATPFSKTFKNSTEAQERQDFKVGISKGLDGIALFGAKVANKAFMAEVGLGNLFSHGTVDFKNMSVSDKYVKNKLDNYIQSEKDKIQSDDFWLETHPRETTLGKISANVGEFVATLPIYEAIGGLARAPQLAEAGLSLTGKLGASPIGRMVGRRLINAADGFMANLITSGGDKKEAIAGGIAGTAIPALAEGTGKAVKRVASIPKVKEYLAKVMSQGGRPLAQELIKSSYSELEATGKHLSEEVKSSAAFRDEPVANTAGGVIVAGERKFPYAGPIQKQTILNNLTEELKANHLAKRAGTDPINDQMHKAMKMAIESVAEINFGKSVKDLDQDEHVKLLNILGTIEHEAAEEAPVHNADILKEDLAKETVEERKNNPVFNEVASMLEAEHGLKIDGSATAEQVVKNVKKQTGISSKKAAIRKVDKTIPKPSKKDITVSLGKVAALKTDSVAYFRAPRNRVQVGKAVSDRGKAGLNSFIDVLKDAIKDTGIHFEDPAHLMLYHLGNRENLPEQVQNTLLYRLKQTKKYEHTSNADLKKEAEWLHTHLFDFAKSGRLAREGNIYRSTKLGGPMSWSKWQNPLANEADDALIQTTRVALTNHPEALRTFNTLVKTFQSNKARYKTPEEYMLYKKELFGSALSILEHATGNDTNIF